MPGIVGLFTRKPKAAAEEELRRMMAPLGHQPSYKKGTWSNPDAGVYVGWVARQGSFSDGMPLQNESGNLSLIFSGEEFPAPNTKSELKKKGHAFGDGASYLVHLAEDDPKFPTSLN